MGIIPYAGIDLAFYQVGVKITILGDTFSQWFFTDSIKQNESH